MEKATSSVIWNFKSLLWNIRDFSEICNLKSTKENVSENEQAPMRDFNTSQEYRCLLDIDFLLSPVIKVGSRNDENPDYWLIKLMKSSNDANCIDLYLELVQIENEHEEDAQNLTQSCQECFFKYKLSILDNNGQPFLQLRNDKIVYLKRGCSWHEPGFIKMDFLQDNADTILQDDTLQLQIDIHVLKDIHHSRSCIFNDSLSPPDAKKRKEISKTETCDILQPCQSKQAEQILKNLWKSTVHSDAIVLCDGVEFPVQKCILSGASPVFKAAFTHNMAESATSSIIVTDLSSKTMELVLRFIYCDTLLNEPEWRNVDQLAEVLNAAEKYQLLTLKAFCFTKLCEEISPTNVATIVTLIYLFRSEARVTKVVYEYVIQNINILKQVESFTKKMKELPAAFAPLLLMIDQS